MAVLYGQTPTRPAIQHPDGPGSDRALNRKVFFDVIGYKPHTQEVWDFHLSDASIRICSAPARTSKSYSAAAEGMVELMPTEPLTESLTWIVGPDYGTNKEFQYYWKWLVEDKCFDAHGVNIVKAHNNPGNGDMLIVIEWGRDKEGRLCKAIVEGKSAKTPDSLQSEDVSFVIMSEAADQPSAIWRKYLEPRYTKAIFPTTPKPQADWIHQMIKSSGDASLGIEHFQYTRFANPFYNHARFERARLMAASRTDSGVADDDPFFAEQFLGKWGSYYTGQVLPFREDRHVVDVNPAWLNVSDIYVSNDYGYDDACVALFWALLPSGAHLLFDEIYTSKLSTQDYVAEIDSRLAAWGVRKRLRNVSGDPRQPQVEHYLRQMGLPVARINKNAQSDRALGHRRLVDLLSNDPVHDVPMLYVGRKCVKTRHEWTHLFYKEGGANEYGASAFANPTKGERVMDHAFDAAKYHVTTFPEPDKEEDGPDWLDVHKRKVRDREFAASPRDITYGLNDWDRVNHAA